MSDLSRLRARWVRLEQRIAKLKLTIEQTGVEERRLVAADAKLRYTNV